MAICGGATAWMEPTASWPKQAAGRLRAVASSPARRARHPVADDPVLVFDVKGRQRSVIREDAAEAMLLQKSE